MTDLEQVNSFIEESRQLSSDHGLRELVQAFAAENGFSYFTLLQNASAKDPAEVVALTNYPDGWVERVRALRYRSDDPVLAASERTAIGFRNSDVAKMVPLTRRQKRTLDESRAAGLGDGFTIPAHVPGEAYGMCTFLVRAEEDLPERRLAVMQLAGSFALEAGRRLRRRRPSQQPARTNLTDRQVECVLLVARGKTDWEISRILGIKEDTVTEYLDEARRRYDVERRAQLVLRAVFDGHLTLRDAIC